ncbi:transcriptional coactivator p15/PC4 family protein [Rubrivivax sp. JA1024]|nr:transcriptional coactivator p15/PC4 family protein [Rubrivivax sp. JA1024]
MAEATPLFLAIAEWPINRREHLRVTIEDFNGSPLLNIRKWYKAEGGDELLPSKRGIALSVRHVGQLTAALSEASREARRLSLTGTAAVPPISAEDAISFAVDRIDDPFVRLDFLDLWRRGEWDELHANWPKAFKA